MRPLPALDHAGQEGARRMNRPEHVDGHHTLEARIPIRRLPVLVPRADRGIQHERVDRADLSGDAARSRPRGSTSATMPAPSPPRRGYRFDDRLACLQVDENELRAKRGADPRGRRADARGRAGHQDAPPGEIEGVSHRLPLGRRGVAPLAPAMGIARKADGQDQHRAVEQVLDEERRAELGQPGDRDGEHGDREHGAPDIGPARAGSRSRRAARR